MLLLCLHTVLQWNKAYSAQHLCFVCAAYTYLFTHIYLFTHLFYIFIYLHIFVCSAQQLCFACAAYHNIKDTSALATISFTKQLPPPPLPHHCRALLCFNTCSYHNTMNWAASNERRESVSLHKWKAWKCVTAQTKGVKVCHCTNQCITCWPNASTAHQLLRTNASCIFLLLCILPWQARMLHCCAPTATHKRFCSAFFVSWV